MNITHKLAALSAAVLLATACSKDQPPESQNALLAYVPAATPFVAANLEPMPDEVVDSWLLRLQPALQQLQGEITVLRTELQAADLDDDAGAAVMAAILAELDGKLDRAGLESLGFSLQPLSAFYGHGMLPVARMGLGDVQTFRAMLDRVQAASGQQLQLQTLDGQDYWKLAEDNSGPAMYAALLDDHLVVGVAPAAMEAQYLPMLLGQQMPANSLADSGALAQLAQDKSYAPYAVGYMDTRLALGELTNPASTTAVALASMGEFDAANLDPACAREAGLISALVPRMTMGSTELGSDTIALQYQVETNPLLGAQLAELVSDVPMAASGDDSIASVSLAVKLGAVRAFMLRQADLLAGFQFQCPQLAGLNQQILAMNEQVRQPMPPLLGNFLGMRASLQAWDPLNPQAASTAGLLSLEMDKPQMVIGMASMLLPGFEQLNIEPGAEPVRLPQELLSVITPDFEVYAMMSKDALGVSLGKGQSASLAAFMEQSGPNGGTFLSFEYDGEVLGAMPATTPAQAYGDQPGDNWQQLAQDYQAMLGRSRMEFRFTEDGLVIDQRQDFR
jgi:hypothetical protein